MAPRCLPVTLAAVLVVACATAQRGIQPGPWSRSKIPDGWVVVKSKHYEIQSQAGKEKAKRLGEHMDVMNRVYRNMFRPDKSGAKKQVIKLFKDRKSYIGYGASPSSAAYYNQNEREMVCYDTGRWSDEEPTTAAVTGEKSAGRRRLERMKQLMAMDILGCAAHEGWHQYFAWLVVSRVVLPSWINEGMGDYFYTAKPNAKPTRRNPAKLGGLNTGRLMMLKAAIRTDRYVPVPDLVWMSKREFYANGSVCYAEGWALCQFLLHSGNERYAEVVPEFIKLVAKDTNMDVVTNKAFKDIDLEQLDEEFRAWIKTLKLPGEDKKDQKPKGEVGQ